MIVIVNSRHVNPGNIARQAVIGDQHVRMLVVARRQFIHGL